MRASIGRVLAGGLLVVSSAVGLGFAAEPASARSAAMPGCREARENVRTNFFMALHHHQLIARADLELERASRMPAGPMKTRAINDINRRKWLHAAAKLHAIDVMNQYKALQARTCR